MAGLLELLQGHSSMITNNVDIAGILLVLARGASYEHTFVDAFSALAHTLMEYVGFGTFKLCIRVVMAFAVSPHTTTETALECVDLLLSLVKRLHAMAEESVKKIEDQRVSSSGSDEQDQDLKDFVQVFTDRLGYWRHLCRPVLLALRALCSLEDPPTRPPLSNMPIRVQAFSALKQLLVADQLELDLAKAAAAAVQVGLEEQPSAHILSNVDEDQVSGVDGQTTSSASPRGQQMSGVAALCYSTVWQCTMDEVLFPLLKDLEKDPSANGGAASGDRDKAGIARRETITKARIGAVQLLSKMFLVHLPQLMARKQGFHLTWFGSFVAQF